MPEELNIDELLDLKTDEERRQRLQVSPVCPSSRLLSICPHPSVLTRLALPLFQVLFRSSSSSTEVRPHHAPPLDSSTAEVRASALMFREQTDRKSAWPLQLWGV